MLTNIIRGEYVTEVRYELAFDDGHGNGYGFPCDANGAVNKGLASSSPAFLMMYSAYKLNKQGDNIQP